MAVESAAPPSTSARASKAASPSMAAQESDPFGLGEPGSPPANDAAGDFLARERAAMAALSLGADAHGARSPGPTLLDAAPSVSSTGAAALEAALAGVRDATRSGASSPPSGAAESETARRMRERREQRIAAADAAAEQLRETRRADAARVLAQYRADEADALERRRAENRAAALAASGDEHGREDYARWDALPPVPAECAPLRRTDVDWAAVSALVAALPRPQKDVSRVLSILQRLSAPRE